MLNDRRKRVLEALIKEYFLSIVPVGSRTLVDRYELGCSSATVRSELSILEETGLLVQPHVSAGRIPTDFGYRSYVDDILSDPSINTDQEIHDRLQVQAAELDDLIVKTSAVLTDLTDALAVVLSPDFAAVTIKRVSVVSITLEKLLLVVVTEDGRALTHHIDMSLVVSPDDLSLVEASLNDRCCGKSSAEIRSKTLHQEIQVTALENLLLHEVLVCLDEDNIDRVHHMGMSALLEQPEFHEAEQITPLLRTLENQITILDAFGDASENDSLIVRIGQENKNIELGHISIIAAPYKTKQSEGFVAVLGPTRMNYGRAISAVRAASEVLSDALK